MNKTEVTVFCHKAAMDPNRPGSDDTSADEGVGLEPLRQEQHADGDQGQTGEGKKLTQYMASIFGKYQGLTFAFPRPYTCMTLYRFSRECSEEW
jgi:hypothetical protein